MPASKPERAFIMDLRAEGDTLEDMLHVAEDFIESARLGKTMTVTGGCTLSGHFSVRRNEITHEQYVEKLHEYLKQEKINESL